MIRLAKDTDVQRIDKYCKEHNLATPLDGIVFISEDETGNLNGVIAGIQRLIIEPMVADNPHIATKLYDHLMGAISVTGVKTVWCIPNKQKLAEELEKLNYTVINTNVSVLEKRI